MLVYEVVEEELAGAAIAVGVPETGGTGCALSGAIAAKDDDGEEGS